MTPAADDAFRAVQFELVAEAEPGIMIRLLAPFAREPLIKFLSPRPWNII